MARVRQIQNSQVPTDLSTFTVTWQGPYLYDDLSAVALKYGLYMAVVKPKGRTTQLRIGYIGMTTRYFHQRLLGHHKLTPDLGPTKYWLSSFFLATRIRPTIDEKRLQQLEAFLICAFQPGLNEQCRAKRPTAARLDMRWHSRGGRPGQNPFMGVPDTIIWDNQYWYWKRNDEAHWRCV